MKDPSRSVKILKTTWIKDQAGLWRINELRELELRPRSGYTNQYFKINNDTISLPKAQRPAPLEFFSLFGTPEFVLRQSIVPIVAWNDGDDEVKCIGTGFFISTTGHLMTAAHVSLDPVDGKYTSVTEVDEASQTLGSTLQFGILLPANPAIKSAPFEIQPPIIREANCFFCSFEWTQHWKSKVDSPFPFQKPEFDLSHDISICKVKEQPILGPFQPLNIGRHNLRIGDRAVAIGYPEMRNFRMKGDNYQPELMVSIGSVTKVIRDNLTSKQNSTPGPNFEFSAKIPGKMSGSPILVGDGILAKGIVSRSWQDEDHASGCLIAPMFSLNVGRGESLLRLMKSGNAGIPELSGPDL